jgi:hypothetical protein
MQASEHVAVTAHQHWWWQGVWRQRCTTVASLGAAPVLDTVALLVKTPASVPFTVNCSTLKSAGATLFHMHLTAWGLCSLQPAEDKKESRQPLTVWVSSYVLPAG